MNKKASFVLYIILAVVSAMLLMMTVLASGGTEGVFGGMVSVIVLAALAIAIIISVFVFNPKGNAYSVGFYVLHIGIVLFLIGSFIYTVDGEKVNVALMKGDDTYYSSVPSGDDIAELGINIRLGEFTEEKYEDGSPKHYEAVLWVIEDGEETKNIVTVNNPIYKGGWKIYLMGVSESAAGSDAEYVSFLFKRDRAEFLTTSGIILIVIGTFMMCFLKSRPKPLTASVGEKTPNSKGKSKKGGAAK